MAIRLIAGLGNPGRKHESDRHNVGFWVTGRLAHRHRITLASEPKFHALAARVALPAGDAWLVQPQTYMNLSGKAVGSIARFYKIVPDEVLAVHDELDFAPGVARLKLGGGVAGHNGLKDIAAQLGSHGFWRLRIGIGHPGDRDRVADYVLSRPPPQELRAIEEAIDRCLEVFALIEAGKMEAAMLRLHTARAPKE